MRLVQLGQELVTLRSIAFPAERLKVVFLGLSAFGYRNDVVYLQQEIRLNIGGVPAYPASVVIPGLDILS